MSFTDVGKDAKRNGATHPKHTQVPPDKPTPKAVKKKKADKPFGLRYEMSFGYKVKEPRKWHETRRWFKTEAHRDQAFDKEAKSQAKWGPRGIFQYRGLKKIERVTP